MSAFSLIDLEQIVQRRASASPEESYTAKLLLDEGTRAAKKFGEEAVELVIASLGNDRTETVQEAADVLYHLLIVLHGAKIPLSDVMAELKHRTQQSGLAEKASRRL